MPKSQQLSRKYLTEVYEQHMAFIKAEIANQKICFILDESPDVPALNTLITFYDPERNQKVVTLVDASILKSCNSTTLALVLALLTLRTTGKMSLDC